MILVQVYKVTDYVLSCIHALIQYLFRYQSCIQLQSTLNKLQTTHANNLLSTLSNLTSWYVCLWLFCLQQDHCYHYILYLYTFQSLIHVRVPLVTFLPFTIFQCFHSVFRKHSLFNYLHQHFCSYKFFYFTICFIQLLQLLKFNC